MVGAEQTCLHFCSCKSPWPTQSIWSPRSSYPMGSFRFSLLSINRDGVPIGVAGHGSYFLTRALGLVAVTCTARAGTSSQIINTSDQSCIRVGEEHYLKKSQFFCFETKNSKIFVVQNAKRGTERQNFAIYAWCSFRLRTATRETQLQGEMRT